MKNTHPSIEWTGQESNEKDYVNKTGINTSEFPCGAIGNENSISLEKSTSDDEWYDASVEGQLWEEIYEDCSDCDVDWQRSLPNQTIEINKLEVKCKTELEGGIFEQKCEAISRIDARNESYGRLKEPLEEEQSVGTKTVEELVVELEDNEDKTTTEEEWGNSDNPKASQPNAAQCEEELKQIEEKVFTKKHSYNGVEFHKTEVQDSVELHCRTQNKKDREMNTCVTKNVETIVQLEINGVGFQEKKKRNVEQKYSKLKDTVNQIDSKHLNDNEIWKNNEEEEKLNNNAEIYQYDKEFNHIKECVGTLKNGLNNELRMECRTGEEHELIIKAVELDIKERHTFSEPADENGQGRMDIELTGKEQVMDHAGMKEVERLQVATAEQYRHRQTDVQNEQGESKPQAAARGHLGEEGAQENGRMEDEERGMFNEEGGPCNVGLRKVDEEGSYEVQEESTEKQTKSRRKSGKPQSERLSIRKKEMRIVGNQIMKQRPDAVANDIDETSQDGNGKSWDYSGTPLYIGILVAIVIMVSGFIIRSRKMG